MGRNRHDEIDANVFELLISLPQEPGVAYVAELAEDMNVSPAAVQQALERYRNWLYVERVNTRPPGYKSGYGIREDKWGLVQSRLQALADELAWKP